MQEPLSDKPKSLFPKLTGRAPVVSPDEVARLQRSRLVSAIIEAVSKRGYDAVTVDEVVALAGVSKSAFYKHFANKQACFLAAYSQVVELGAERIEAAERSQAGARKRIQAAHEAFVDTVLEHEGAARLALVESLNVGEAAISSRERTARRYEAGLGRSLAPEDGSAPVPPLVIRAVFGGLHHLAYRHLRDREAERLREHVPDLVEWAIGYMARPERQPVGSRLADAAFERRAAVDEGRNDGSLGWEEPANSDRSRAGLSQRERIMRATAQVAAEAGYSSLTVPAISNAAGVSNQTFYQHFASKEKAFLAAFDALALRAFEVTGAAFAQRDDWLEAGAGAMLALLEFLANDRLFRQINFFELHAAGPVAQDRAEAMLMLFAAFMQPDPVPPEVKSQPPKVVIDAIAGGLWAVIQQEIVAGRSESLPELLPEILDIVLQPFGVE